MFSIFFNLPKKHSSYKPETGDVRFSYNFLCVVVVKRVGWAEKGRRAQELFKEP